jgi:hypothetical protein
MAQYGYFFSLAYNHVRGGGLDLRVWVVPPPGMPESRPSTGTLFAGTSAVGPRRAVRGRPSGSPFLSPCCGADDGGVEDDENVFVALHSFEARTENELCFQRGEKLRIASRNDDNWWKAGTARTGRGCHTGRP